MKSQRTKAQVSGPQLPLLSMMSLSTMRYDDWPMSRYVPVLDGCLLTSCSELAIAMLMARAWSLSSSSEARWEGGGRRGGGLELDGAEGAVEGSDATIIGDFGEDGRGGREGGGGVGGGERRREVWAPEGLLAPDAGGPLSFGEATAAQEGMGNDDLRKNLE